MLPEESLQVFVELDLLAVERNLRKARPNFIFMLLRRGPGEFQHLSGEADVIGAGLLADEIAKGRERLNSDVVMLLFTQHDVKLRALLAELRFTPRPHVFEGLHLKHRQFARRRRARRRRLEIVDPDGPGAGAGAGPVRVNNLEAPAPGPAPARELSVFEVEALKNMRSRRETKLREESAKLDVMLREQKHNDVTIEPLSALRDLVRQQAGPDDICLARQVLELARAAAQKHEDEIRARLSQIPLDRKQIQFDENLQRFLWEHCGWTSPSCQSDLSNDLKVSNVFRASAASSCGGRSLFYAVLF